MNIIDVLHLFFSLRYDKFTCVIIGHGLFKEVMEQMKKRIAVGLELRRGKWFLFGKELMIDYDNLTRLEFK